MNKSDSKKWIYYSFILILILLIGKSLLSILIAIFLLTLGSCSLLYRYVIPISIGFELITFTSVLFTAAFDPILGIASACFMVLVSSILAQRTCLVMFLKMISYSIALLIGWFFVNNIIIAGIIVVITYNIILHSMLLFGGFSVKNSIISLPFNIYFNYYFLTMLAPIFLKLI